MPIFARPLVVVATASYLLAVILVGFWAARRTRTARDFWIAGQGIGLWVTGIAATSAAFSGFVFIGGPGLMYSIGLASVLIVAPAGFTSALHCWLVAKRLRLLSEVREIYTIPDAILCRYGSRVASGTAAVAVLVGTIAYLGSQFLALGRLLESVFGTRELFGDASLYVAMAIGVTIVLLYSVLGGMVAGVYTDLLQGGLMAIAALVVFLHAISISGGLERAVTSIETSPRFGPGFLDPLGTAPVMTALGFVFVFGTGTLGQPHVLHKFFMLDDPLKLKWMPIVMGGSQSVCLLIWLGVGLAVPALVSQGLLSPLSQPDDAAPTFLLELTPPLITGLVLAGLLAAIMSTADSFVNIGSAALVRDIPNALGLGVARELLFARIAVLAVSSLAVFLAISYGDLVALLGTFAFGTFGAALAPVLAVGLNWKRVTAKAATCAMATGIAANVTFEILSRRGVFLFAPGVLPTAVATAASFTMLFVVSTLSRPRELDGDVAAVMDA
ncbi:MAG TPA: sodium/proline symporter [Vicinamibacteria bacterium]|nr:sodium/proline symporter [Vicinamibacteria bacterium]